MTYRRLFFYLLTAGTLVLAATYRESVRNYHSAMLYSPIGSVDGTMFDGRFCLELHAGSFAWEFAHGTTPAAEIRKLFGTASPLGSPPPPPQLPGGPIREIPWYYQTPDLPLLLPYLLHVAGAFAFCRFMEKRSHSPAPAP